MSNKEESKRPVLIENIDESEEMIKFLDVVIKCEGLNKSGGITRNCLVFYDRILDIIEWDKTNPEKD